VTSALLALPQLFIFSLREVGDQHGTVDCWAKFGGQGRDSPMFKNLS
jgi:hypothetical protein